MPSAGEQTAIVGAGPYGLAAAASLRARGLPITVFGEVMGFWEQNMPRGMLVRSAWGASSIRDPKGPLSLDAYEAEQPEPFSRPLPGEEMPRYGRWFQQRAVPDLDERLITTVELDGSEHSGRPRFLLTTRDGEHHEASRVIVATGLASFPVRPAQFGELSDELAIHSMDVPEPARFEGQSLAIVGCGQSAVETAALLSEAGAQVELIARAPGIRWLIRGEQLRGIDPYLQRILYAPTDVGPAGVSRLVAIPDLFKHLPRDLQDRLAYRSIRPAATSWLMERIAEVRLTFGRQVRQASSNGAGLSLRLDDGSQRKVDRVILATGYQVDVDREALIGGSIRARLHLRGGYPVLGPGMESSVPGLHFLGAYSAWSFGPIMRFVCGTWYTGRALARHLVR